MTNTNILSKAITAALLLCAASSHAATLLNGATGAGELFVGFRASSGTGSGKNVVIDIGSASALAALAPGSTVFLGNVGADLSSSTTGFGSNWYDRPEVTWSAVSGNNGTDIAIRTLYGSVSGTGLFPLSTVGYTRAGSTTQNGIVGNILSMASGNQGFTGAGSGSSPNIALETPVTGDNSWSNHFGASPFTGFGSPNGQVFEQGFTAGGPLASGYEGALDVFRMVISGTVDPDNGSNGISPNPTGGTYQFTLTINNLGEINANVLPVPEPAAIGLLMSGSMLFLGFRRREANARVQTAAAA